MNAFEQEKRHDEVDENIMILANNQVSKLHKKMRLALFDLLMILLIPLIFKRYQDFDVMHQSSVFNVLLGLSMMIFLFIFIYQLLLPKADFSNVKDRTMIKWQSELMDLISYVLTLMVIMITINTFFFSFAMVDGISMEPTFVDQDDIIINHFMIDYDQFDIVVVRVREGTYYVKRIIGLPGDRVTFTESAVYINGDLISERYLDQSFAYTPNEFILGEDEYFVMGDNRDDSLDSRVIGPVNERDLFGKVIFRVRPLERFGSVN
ncbi:MAG: signal peptidase I [Candidatus Izemoplasmataceae bacterium]